MQVNNDLSFLSSSAEEVAPMLLGCILQRRINHKIIIVRIVETEAYDQSDAASHSYKKETKRTEVMFGPSGKLYVYFTYGMHYCCNVVVGQSGEGAAVLIRAVEPIDGIEEISKRRNGRPVLELTNGPAKLCQALAIDTKLNGHDLNEDPLLLIPAKLKTSEEVIQTTRVGISQAKDTNWRFYIKDNKYVSRK